MTRSSGAMLAATLFALWAADAAAQQRDTLRADTMVFRIEEIRVQARRPVTTVGGASATEVTVDSLALPAGPTVENLLRDLPSVHVRTNSRGEAEVSVRGSESRQVALLLDGVPLTLGWDARTDVSVLPASAPHEVTVVRGLSSILHGPNVLGGVVEMSVAHGASFPERSSLRATAGYDDTGAYAASVSSSSPFATGGGRWLVRAGVGFADSPGLPLAEGVVEPQPAGESLRLNTDVRQTSGFVSLRHDRDGGSWFTFTTTAFEAERGIAAELGAESPRLWRYPHISRTIVATSFGTGERVTPLGRADAEVTVGVDVGRTEIESFATRAYDSVTGTEDSDDRTVSLRLLGDHTLGGRGDLRTAATFANIRHDATVEGDELEYEQRLWSFGAESVWRLHENPGGIFEAVRLSAGGALDGGDTPRSGGLPSLGTLSDWGARLGMTALVNDGKTLVHAGVSRRGRFPSLRETYSEALGRFEPNPDLRPERLVAVEGGVTTKLGQGELQIVGFHHRLSGAIRRITLPDRRRKRVNSDRIEGTGLELLFDQLWGPVGLGGDMTLQTVDVVDPQTSVSTRPENTPEVSARAFVRLPPYAGVSATAELDYTGSQFCQDPDTGADVKLAGGSWLNAHLSRVWRFASASARPLGRLETRVSVENLSDDAVFDQCGLPRPGRLFRFQVKLF